MSVAIGLARTAERVPRMLRSVSFLCSISFDFSCVVIGYEDWIGTAQPPAYPDPGLLLALAFGSMKRISGEPAVRSSDPIDAACPMQIVQISGRTYCMVS